LNAAPPQTESREEEHGGGQTSAVSAQTNSVRTSTARVMAHAIDGHIFLTAHHAPAAAAAAAPDGLRRLLRAVRIEHRSLARGSQAASAAASSWRPPAALSHCPRTRTVPAGRLGGCRRDPPPVSRVPVQQMKMDTNRPRRFSSLSVRGLLEQMQR